MSYYLILSDEEWDKIQMKVNMFDQFNKSISFQKIYKLL